jgi:hypothetical protein
MWSNDRPSDRQLKKSPGQTGQDKGENTALDSVCGRDFSIALLLTVSCWRYTNPAVNKSRPTSARAAGETSDQHRASDQAPKEPTGSCLSDFDQ